MSVADCLQSERYGIVLGPSTFFGAGSPAMRTCMASLLAERFGFPFANAAMPGGNSRNLNALLVGLVAGANQPPAVVVLSNGGDLANFCEAVDRRSDIRIAQSVAGQSGRQAGADPDADSHSQAAGLHVAVDDRDRDPVPRLSIAARAGPPVDVLREDQAHRDRERVQAGPAAKRPHKQLFANFRSSTRRFSRNARKWPSSSEFRSRGWGCRTG